MGKLLAFPRTLGTSEPLGRGCVHCWVKSDGGYEIGHESRSGDSWGSFEQFTNPQEAIAGAYSLARAYGSGCEVRISPAVIDAVPETIGNACQPGEW